MSQQPLPCTAPTQNGGFIFFAWVSSSTKIFCKKKVDFVGDIRIGTHQNVVLRHNHLNQISTNLASFNNNEYPIILQVSLRRRNCINNLVIYVMVM